MSFCNPGSIEEQEWGERLSFVLRRKGLSQRSVSEEMGVSPAAVNKWMVGGNIDYVHLRRLAQYLRVNWVWLRYGNEALTSVVEERRGERERLDYAGNKLVHVALLSEETHLAFCSKLKIGVWAYDIKNDIHYHSPMMREMIGVARDAPVTAGTVKNRIFPPDLDAGGRFFSGLVNQDKPMGFYSFRLRSNPAKWFHMLGFPIRGPNMKVERLIGSLHQAENENIDRVISLLTNGKLSED